MVRTSLPGASVGGDRDAGLGHCRRSGQPRRGHQRTAIGVGAGPVDGQHHVQSRARHRHRGTGRPRSRRVGAPPAAQRRRAADDLQAGQRPLAGAVGRAVRQPVDPRAHRTGRQGGQAAARTVGGRRRGADHRRAGTRHQHLDRSRSTFRLPAADHRGAGRAAAAERRCAGRQRHDQPARANAADDGPLYRGRAVQRPRHRHPKRRAHPRARHRPTPRTAPKSNAPSPASTACQRWSSKSAANRAPTPWR